MNFRNFDKFCQCFISNTKKKNNVTDIFLIYFNFHENNLKNTLRHYISSYFTRESVSYIS